MTTQTIHRKQFTIAPLGPREFEGKASDPSLDLDIVEKYDDQFQIRAGAEHRMAMWKARFGYYFDKSPAPTESVTPLLPDANRHGVTLGFGMDRGKWTIDAYNLFLFVQNRSTDSIVKRSPGYFHSAGR